MSDENEIDYSMFGEDDIDYSMFDQKDDEIGDIDYSMLDQKSEEKDDVDYSMFDQDKPQEDSLTLGQTAGSLAIDVGGSIGSQALGYSLAPFTFGGSLVIPF